MSLKAKRSRDACEDKQSPNDEKKVKLLKSDEQRTTSGDGKDHSTYFHGLQVFVIDAGIGKTRASMFKKQLQKYGSCVQECYSQKADLVLVDETVTPKRICTILGLSGMPNIFEVKVVKLSWVTACLKNKQRLSFADYLVDFTSINKSDEKTKTVSESETEEKTADQAHSAQTSSEEKDNKLPKVGGMWKSHKKKYPQEDSAFNDNSDSDYVESEEEKDISDDDTSKKKVIPGHWVCAHSSGNKRENFNEHVTEKLKEMAEVYESTNEKWRAMSYKKAIGTLQRYPKPITSFEEAKALPGIGEKLAEKIWEIIESGELRKLDELTGQEEVQALKLFTNIWGAGTTTARTWVQAGFRTLDDIRNKAHLTRQQKIGLQYYDDLLERMQRSEAAEIEAVVKKAAFDINPGLTCLACGSYRRGKATCGDVDILVTHPDGKSHKGVFHKLLDSLHTSGFLTDDLVTQEENGNQKKYLGVCKLSGENTKHRRLDIIVVPYDEYACAIMYFTGSAYFNRSMRLLAKKKDMSLTEHSLNKDVVRHNSEKINRGIRIPTWTEEDVFRHLDLPYRPPEERDH